MIKIIINYRIKLKKKLLEIEMDYPFWDTILFQINYLLCDGGSTLYKKCIYICL